MNWTAEEASLATKGEFFSNWQGGKIVFDSRLIEPNDIFIALPGTYSDGHQHVLEALNKGASGAIVSKIPDNITSKEKLLIVEDTIRALNDLAIFRRQTSKAKFIAVTGSVGKTSTKELLKLAFSAHGITFASRGNYNNFLGVPINLASLPNDAEYAIFEVGMDHAGEIEPLSELLKPDVAIITAIENIHRANFDSIEGIAKAKSEIFYGSTPNTIAIINSLSNCYNLLLESAKQKTVNKIISLGSDSKVISYNVANNKTTATLNILGKDISINVNNIIGAHQIHNMMCVLTCIVSLGLNPTLSIQNLQSFQLPRGRGLVSKIYVDKKEITLIDDSYNAGPVSVKAALKNMVHYKGRKVAILGDMVDMGPDSLELHTGLKEDILANNIDKIICFGKQMQSLYEHLPDEKKLGNYLTLEELAEELPNKLLQDDVLLIKGSLYITKLYEFTKNLSENNLNYYKR